MAPASRAAVDTNRWYAWTRGRSDVGAAVSLWVSYCWQAIVYASLIPAGPVAGHVTAIVAAGLCLLLGAARPLSFVPSGAICAVVGATLAAVPKAHAQAALVTLGLSSAGLLLAARALRCTLLQRLLPEPVRVGFLAGIGVTVAVAESAELALNGPVSLAVGAASIALLLMLRRLGSSASAPWLVLALALATSAIFDLEGRGVQVVGSASMAFAPVSLSALLEGSTLVPLLLAAPSIAVLASGHPLVAAESCASRTGAGPGARRAAALAGVVSIPSLALSNVLGQLPLATISAILLVMGLGWIDARRLSELRRGSPPDFRMALVAAFGVTIFGPRWGVAIGVVAALRQTFQPAPTTRDVSSPGASEGQQEGADARAQPVSEGSLVYRRRHRGYRWVRAAWPPRRRTARRSGATRDEAADGVGNRSRLLR